MKRRSIIQGLNVAHTNGGFKAHQTGKGLYAIWGTYSALGFFKPPQKEGNIHLTPNSVIIVGIAFRGRGFGTFPVDFRRSRLSRDLA